MSASNLSIFCSTLKELVEYLKVKCPTNTDVKIFSASLKVSPPHLQRLLVRKYLLDANSEKIALCDESFVEDLARQLAGVDDLDLELNSIVQIWQEGVLDFNDKATVFQLLNMMLFYGYTEA